MRPQQELKWLHEALGNVAASAERDGPEDDAAEAEGACARGGLVARIYARRFRCPARALHRVHCRTSRARAPPLSRAPPAGASGATDKKATARRMHFRSGLDDKRLKPVGGMGMGGVDDRAADKAPAAAEAAPAAAEGADAAADGGGDDDEAPVAAVSGGRGISEDERKLLQELGKELASKAPPGLADDPRLRRRQRPA